LQRNRRVLVGGKRFIEVYVNTPLEVCEGRDAKGMYALAREGKIKNFTGIDDPYEPPHNPEIAIDTVRCTAEENARRILSHLIAQGFVRPISSDDDEGVNMQGVKPEDVIQ
jgi:adenylylsulfate kinase-like enzyme